MFVIVIVIVIVIIVIIIIIIVVVVDDVVIVTNWQRTARLLHNIGSLHKSLMFLVYFAMSLM